VESIFSVEFSHLGVDDVRAFLDDAVEEGLNWEAKAGDRDEGKGVRAEHIRKSVCALANQIGGWVLIGATRRDGRWQLPGIAMPASEPGLWLDQVIAGLRPLPRCRHHHWVLESGRLVAVIEVQPTTATPCMTNDGQVFERVSSESIQVKDPLRLHELITRGRNARARAEAHADRAAERFSGTRAPYADTTVRFAVGLAATSYEPDISSRLFHSSFPRRLEQLMDARCYSDLGQQRETDAHRIIQQDHLQLAVDAAQLHWVACAGWDGSAAVLAAVNPESAGVFAAVDFAIWPAWKLAVQMVDLLGGYGDASMTLIVTIRNQSVHLPGRTIPPLTAESLWGRLQPETRLRRQAAVTPPTDAEVGTIQRELQRAGGLWSHEGVPDPPGGPN
jgi:hypothetical protein